MLSKIKEMYEEWKEVVMLLIIAAMVFITILLVDVAPAIAIGLAICLGCVLTALGVEE